jgi:chemotaxis response regulator CheB
METSVRVLVANRPRLFRELVVSTLSKDAGIEVVGETANDKDVPSLVAKTKPDFVLITLDESRRRPPLCDQLLREFIGVRIIAVALNTNIGISYWASLEIHSKTMGMRKDILLKVVRENAPPTGRSNHMRESLFRLRSEVWTKSGAARGVWCCTACEFVQSDVKLTTRCLLTWN